MNYELAKKLKEAGYEGTDKTLWKGGKDLEFGELLPFPTLSEVFEQWGNRFCGLYKNWITVGVVGTDGWVAQGQYRRFGNFTQEGQSPEEAVAKIWLELQKENEL